MAFEIEQLDYGGAIRAICRQVGHPLPADPAGSTDPAVIQMGAAVNAGLTELLGLYEWQQLTVRASIPVTMPVAVDEASFALPEDFFRFIDQTQWSGESFLPAGGPVAPQGWMLFLVQKIEPILTLTWQMREGMIWFLRPPVTPDVLQFQFMYLSQAQVIDADVPTTLKNFAEKNGDKFRLPGYLVQLYGRGKYLEWKGFDASAAYRDFWSAFNTVTAANKGANVLTLGRPMGMPLLSTLNLPRTGYGS